MIPFDIVTECKPRKEKERRRWTYRANTEIVSGFATNPLRDTRLVLKAVGKVELQDGTCEEFIDIRVYRKQE